MRTKFFNPNQAQVAKYKAKYQVHKSKKNKTREDSVSRPEGEHSREWKLIDEIGLRGDKQKYNATLVRARHVYA